MPLTSFTIGGIEVDPLLDGFEIRETTGTVATLVCNFESVGSPVYRPSVHEEVIVQEDGVRIFAGIITQVHERGFGGPNLYDDDTGAPQILTSITAEDYARLAARVAVSETVADGTLLKTFLTTLVTNYLAALGVTLDAAQVNGPALPAMTFDYTSGADVLQALSDATGYVSHIDYSKQLRMWLPGDLTAPFDIDETDDPPSWGGDVEVERILGDDYANRVVVIGDEVTEYGHVENFVGDGFTTTFTLEYTPFMFRGYVTYDTIHYETLNRTGDADAAMWTYDQATNTITRNIGAPALGAPISINFDGTFTPMATAEDAAAIALYGLYEYVERRSDITTQAAAQALADAILAERLLAGDQIVTYQTRLTAPSFHVGQQQTLTAPARDVSGDYLITDLRVQAEVPLNSDFAAAGLGLIRTVTAKRSQIISGKWQQTYHDWLSDTRGGTGVAIGDGGGSGGTPALPDTSVQWNNSGSFGGDENFEYKAAQHSLICGDGCTITAADFESCQVFGSDCHITD